MAGSFDSLGTISDALGKLDERELWLLHTQLLVEEKIKEYLRAGFKKQECVDDANLSFKQALTLAEGMSSENVGAWFWEAVSALNKIRNQLAHSYPSPEMEDKISALLGLIVNRGMKPSLSENYAMLHPVKGPLAYLYSYSCHICDHGSAVFLHKEQTSHA